MAPDKVVIVGGGIGGLAAALALLKRGIDVDVYEQAGPDNAARGLSGRAN